MTDRLTRLLAHDFGILHQTYGPRDTILYALGCGAGAEDLTLVSENGLTALPTFATTLCSQAAWYFNTGGLLDGTQVVHGSERVTLMAPLPPAGQVRARTRIAAVHDRGPGRGALVVFERDILLDPDGTPLARVTTRALYRGDGGIGGTGHPAPVAATLPDRAPDHSLRVPTSPRAAVIYRLSGDENPLHINPVAAARAGFAAPILHGLSTYGHVARAVRAHRPGAALRMMDCRFTAPVLPGATLVVDLWDTGPDDLTFRVHADGRRVIDNGEMTFWGTSR